MTSALDFGDSIPQAAPPGAPQRTGLTGLKWGIKHHFYDAVPGQVADLRRILQEFPADALVCDTAFIGAGALHELGGPPYAVFGITALTLGSRDTAPFGTALAPDSSPLGRLRNRALAALFQHGLFRDVNTYANGVRRALDLPPLRGNVLDSMSPFLYLHSSTPTFEYPRSDLPPQVHFIGPLLPPPPPDFAPPAWWPELHAGKPVVLVTQGTVATDDSDLIVPTLRALADEDVLVVATASSAIAAQLGNDLPPPRVHIGIVPHYGGVLLHANLITLVDAPAPPQRGVLPANARLEPFIPFGQIMPHVDVMITNGGYGGVQFALAHGVPLVVAGATEEKPEIAARVAWSDAGINLKAKSPTTAQIRTAVRSILADPRYRQNA
ncbi:MAG: glycosyl transferase, UDP-glucuronosyltransferase, partial [Chloroflexales bacterium]|nr:glycosyl transferase, UDP-glucuronosyltransferase [Chloroflexales bacterium]